MDLSVFKLPMLSEILSNVPSYFFILTRIIIAPENSFQLQRIGDVKAMSRRYDLDITTNNAVKIR